jgi:hypothetical protein
MLVDSVSRPFGLSWIQSDIHPALNLNVLGYYLSSLRDGLCFNATLR